MQVIHNTFVLRVKFVRPIYVKKLNRLFPHNYGGLSELNRFSVFGFKHGFAHSSYAVQSSTIIFLQSRRLREMCREQTDPLRAG